MSDDVSTARVVEIMEDYYGTHAYSIEAAFTALARDHAALQADRDRLADERLTSEDARANLLLQTICRLPDVLTEGDWQQWLDQHRDAWLNDDRAFGGWIAERLRAYTERVAADLEAVRRVEAWVMEDPSYRSVERGDETWIAREYPPGARGWLTVATGDSIPALGRALAAREASNGKG